MTAQTDAERRAAVETTPARKLREIRMALTLDKTFTKPEILTRYLNLVSFGNNAFGVQDAAQTYFGINAVGAELAAGRAAGRHGAVDQHAEPLHQPRRRTGPPKPGAGHHDRRTSPSEADELRAAKAAAAGHPAAAQRAAARLHRRRRSRVLLRLRAGLPGARRHQ